MANEIEACKACEDLKSLSNNFVLNGVTETECASLNKNFGLNDQIPVLHDNCEDLRTTLDCLIGQLIEELPKYDNCDWKAYASSYMKNLYTVLRAMMCGDCGQWNEINYLWDETELLWRETQKLWEELIKVWNETDKLWRETAKLLSEIYTVWQELIAIWEYIDVLEGRILNLEYRMDAVEDRLDVVEDRLDVVDNRLDAVENRVTVVENRISNAETNITNLTNRVTTIEGNISTINNRLTNIDNSIRDIYDILDALSGANYTTLTRGTDYNLYFYNGFTTQEAPSDLTIRISETNSLYYLTIDATTAVATKNLQNPNLMNVEMRHGTNVEEVPLSHIVRVQFIGNYANLNTIANWTNTSGSSNGIWNLYPKASRASWQATIGISRNTSRGTGWLFSWTSFADGYNTQLADWYTGNLEGRYLGMSLSMTLIK